MPESKTYYAVDNVIIGANHVINNAGCVNLIQRINDTNAIIKIFAEDTHLKNLTPKLNKIANKKLEYHPIDVINPAKNPLQKIYSWILKLKSDQIFIKTLLRQATVDQPEFILFSTITAVNLYRFIHIIGRQGKQKVLIGLHGEIESIFLNETSLKNKLIAYFYKKTFSTNYENIKFLVLSPLIKTKMVQYGLLKEHQIICIQHPINEANRLKTDFPANAPIFAQLGVASLRKNSQAIFDLGLRLRNQIMDKKASIEIIGKVAPDTVSFSNDLVKVSASKSTPISQDVYEKLIMDATYSLSFITGHEYVYRISGSLMDSIQYQLPLIALKHDFVTDLFERAGDIGFLCEDLAEMAIVMDKIIQNDKDFIGRYPLQIQNLRNYAQQFYDTNNVIFFKKNLADAGWLI